MNLYFDIETGPKDIGTIQDLWGVIELRSFDPGSVSTGKLKDPAKIQAKIEEARREFPEKEKERILQESQELIDKSLLKAEACHVLTIARKCGDLYKVPECGEREMLEEFWEVVKYHRDRGQKIVGFNIKSFDLPVLIRKSWELGVRVPPALIDKDRYWSSCFVDLMEKWRLGSYRDYIKLEVLAKSMGFACGKPMSGKDFHVEWGRDREKAIGYVKTDLDMTEFVATKLGVGV